MAHVYSAQFLEVWAAAPRKEGGKWAASVAYARARKRGATHAEILTGMKRYAARNPQYVCHVSTFLNQGRYEDEYPPSRSVPNGPAPLNIWDVCQHEPQCRSFSEHERRNRS